MASDPVSVANALGCCKRRHFRVGSHPRSTPRNTRGWVLRVGRFRAGFVALLLVALSLPVTAFGAEPSAVDKETARNFLSEGDDRFAAKDYAAALKAYEAAHKIMQVPTTGLPLAKAQIARGLFVEASETLLGVSRMPVDPGEKPAFTQAREEAAQLAVKLSLRIPAVVISVEGPPKGADVEVWVDGVPVPAESLGSPKKINPGPHKISASAPGFETVTKSVASREGDTKSVALQLKPGGSTGGTEAKGAAGAAGAAEAPPAARFHLGFSAAASMLLPLDGGPPYYGAAPGFVFQIALNPQFDLRTGLTASVLHRGDDDTSRMTVVVPVMVRWNYTPWFSAAVGLSAGFGTTFRDNETGAAVGPEWSVLSMYAGEKRQYELAFTQGLRFGNIPAEYHQSVVFTYLFRD